ncbi:MAG: hypothetical protein LUQ00_02740 [Candidatus Methanomethyliaceae archaeon]|nr:hypothetical protein [Candidatus Methanomethyliaceae archaeon]
MSEDAIRKATKIINELKLTPKGADEYEDCEIISDLMDDEMMKHIEDEEFRRVLWEIRRLHVEVRRMNYAAYIDMAKELLGKIPDMKYVLRYHELERLSKKINEKEIKLIRDPNVRDTLFKVVHIHDDIVDKKANVIRMIKLR